MALRDRAVGVPGFWTDAQHGPLPLLLLALTVVTGLVDAVSFLKLGHVFVANMTGNVVFLGFAISDPQNFSVLASAASIVAFLAGALAGGRLGVSGAGNHRARLLAVASTIETVLVAVALVATTKTVDLNPTSFTYTLIALLAFAMGVQNATSRRLGVPDMTTTVLTLTLTGFAADSILAGGTNPNPRRRLLSVAAMFLGAAIGAFLVLRHGIALALALSLVLLVVAGIAAYCLASSTEAWTTRSK